MSYRSSEVQLSTNRPLWEGWSSPYDSLVTVTLDAAWDRPPVVTRLGMLLTTRHRGRIRDATYDNPTIVRVLDMQLWTVRRS